MFVHCCVNPLRSADDVAVKPNFPGAGGEPGRCTNLPKNARRRRTRCGRCPVGSDQLDLDVVAAKRRRGPPIIALSPLKKVLLAISNYVDEPGRGGRVDPRMAKMKNSFSIVLVERLEEAPDHCDWDGRRDLPMEDRFRLGAHFLPGWVQGFGDGTGVVHESHLATRRHDKRLVSARNGASTTGLTPTSSHVCALQLGEGCGSRGGARAYPLPHGGGYPSVG
jgi:hypothetical protein